MMTMIVMKICKQEDFEDMLLVMFKYCFMRSRGYCGYCAISGDIWIRDYISNRVGRNPN